MFARRLHQLAVLIVKRLHNFPPAQSACGGFFQEYRPGIEGLIIRPTGTPGTVIQYVVPDEHFPGQPGFDQTPTCNVTTRYVKHFDHRSFLLPTAS
jgi:hypothetical protein